MQLTSTQGTCDTETPNSIRQIGFAFYAILCHLYYMLCYELYAIPHFHLIMTKHHVFVFQPHCYQPPPSLMSASFAARPPHFPHGYCPPHPAANGPPQPHPPPHHHHVLQPCTTPPFPPAARGTIPGGGVIYHTMSPRSQPEHYSR
jgi:hypothetical protein